MPRDFLKGKIEKFTGKLERATRSAAPGLGYRLGSSVRGYIAWLSLLTRRRGGVAPPEA